MTHAPRPITKSKLVITTFVISVLGFAWKLVDAVSNTEYLLQKLGFDEQISKFLSSPRGSNILVYGGLLSLILALFYHVRRYEQGLANWYGTAPPTDTESTREGGKQWHQTPEYDLTSRMSTQAGEKQDKQAKEEDSLAHNLVALATKIIPVGQSRDGVFYEDREETLAAVVVFSNLAEPSRKVAPVSDLRAHIEYYDTSGEIHYRVNDATWLGDDSTYISLDVGDAEKLMVAILASKGQALTVENKYTSDSVFGRSYSPLIKRLWGKAFHVKVRLVGGREGDVAKDFEFILTAEPEFRLDKWDEEKFTQIGKASRLDIAKRLTDFIDEGNGILQRCANTSEPPISEAEDWAQRARAYVNEVFDEFHAIDFFKEAGLKPYPGGATNRRLVDLLYTRLERLADLISTLRNG